MLLELRGVIHKLMFNVYRKKALDFWKAPPNGGYGGALKCLDSRVIVNLCRQESVYDVVNYPTNFFIFFVALTSALATDGSCDECPASATIINSEAGQA